MPVTGAGADGAGGRSPALGEVLELVEAYAAVLSTGHVAPGEALAVAHEYRSGGASPGGW